MGITLRLLGTLLCVSSVLIGMIAFAGMFKVLERANDDNRIWIIIGYHCLTLALGALYYFGRVLRRRRTETDLRLDPRPRIVWLRSFRNDELRVDSIVSHIPLDHESHFLSFKKSKLEELIVEMLSNFGPVVAIDGDRPKRFTLGAYRLNTNELSWKKTVHEQVSLAKYVFVLLDSTPSLMWELAQIREIAPLEKIFLLVPPHEIRKRLEWYQVWNELISRENIVPKVNYKEIDSKNIYAITFDANWPEYHSAKNSKSKQYFRALRDLLTEKYGVEEAALARLRTTAKKSWRYPGYLLASILTGGSVQLPPLQLVVGIINITLLVLSIKNLVSSSRAPRRLKNLVRGHLLAGYVANLLAIGIPLFGMIAILMSYLAK